jgi:hypothetical protein
MEPVPPPVTFNVFRYTLEYQISSALVECLAKKSSEVIRTQPNT